MHGENPERLVVLTTKAPRSEPDRHRLETTAIWQDLDMREVEVQRHRRDDSQRDG